MFNGLFHIREPKNEPILGYEPGTAARTALKAELQRMLNNPVEVPCIINGRDVATGDLVDMKDKILTAIDQCPAQCISWQEAAD